LAVNAGSAGLITAVVPIRRKGSLISNHIQGRGNYLGDSFTGPIIR
jgi:hypothetical protein